MTENPVVDYGYVKEHWGRSSFGINQYSGPDAEQALPYTTFVNYEPHLEKSFSQERDKAFSLSSTSESHSTMSISLADRKIWSKAICVWVGAVLKET